MMRPSPLRLPLLLLALLAARAAPVPAADDPRLARWRGGEVRVSDVRRERDFLPMDERRFRERTGAGGERAVADWVRRIALREIAVMDAAARGGPPPDAARRARDESRRWAVALLRERGYGRPVPDVALGEVRRELERTDPGLPPRVRLSGIFRPAAGPDEVATEFARLESVRAERLDLRCFRERARELSLGSTAPRGGEIGWMRQGWLDPDAERLLFGLSPGTVAPPIVLRGGVHLFFVEEFAPGGSAISEGMVLAEASRRRGAALDAARRDALFRAGFRAEPGIDPADAIRLEEEALVALALREGTLDSRERRAMADREANVILAAGIEAERERRFVPPTDEELALRFSAVAEGWRTPTRYELRLLTVRAAGADDPVSLWGRLRRLAEDLRTGARAWDDGVREIGGVSEAIAMDDAHQVAGRVGPPLFEQLRDLRVGEVAGPVQDGAELLLAQVTGREESRPRTLAESRDRLLADLSRESRRRLSDEIAGEMLERAGFEWAPDAPAQIARLAFEEAAP